jgi:hypothetical protein
MTVDAIDFALTECLFKGFGSNAIQLRRSTRGAYIANNRFLNVGMSAIYVGSYHSTYEIPDPRTVSDELRAIIRAHISYNVRVENNYFEHIGYDYPNANCVHYYFVDGMKVLHNTIMGCAYSGVSSGTGWRALFVPGEFVNVRNVEVAYNRIHNFYSTTPVDMQNNAPHRDSILLDFYVETAGIEALCEKYEGARAICEGAGCHLDI